MLVQDNISARQPPFTSFPIHYSLNCTKCRAEVLESLLATALKVTMQQKFSEIMASHLT
jgi:hypothetical protein